MKITITDDHLALLAKMDFDWDDGCEWGSVASDCKRPFGNSGVERDVSEILGREVDYGEARRLTIELAAIVQRAVSMAVAAPENVGIEPGITVALGRRARALLESSWTAKGACHCGGCHRLFATLPLFDAHRSAEGEHGTCLDPATLLGESGQRRLFFRAGMWRGPELTEEQRATLRERVWGGGADDAIPA